jgi:hypothetical protein
MRFTPVFVPTLEQREQLLARWPDFDEKKVKYSHTYDAFYYEETMEWLEPKCEDINCDFCMNRSDIPTP